MTLVKMQLAVIGVFVVISMVISTFFWPYAINEWLQFFDKDATMLWWHGTLFGIIPPVGFLSIPVALVTFVSMLFL